MMWDADDDSAASACVSWRLLCLLLGGRSNPSIQPTDRRNDSVINNRSIPCTLGSMDFGLGLGVTYVCTRYGVQSKVRRKRVREGEGRMKKSDPGPGSPLRAVTLAQ